MLTGVKRILFIGDSLTDGSDYPDYVVNTIRACRPGIHLELYNSAICGDTAAGLVRRFHAEVLALLPDLVCIAIGTNDCPCRPVADFARDMEYLVVRMRENGIKVMLLAPSPCGESTREQAFQQYLQVIHQLAEKYHCVVADAHQVFLDWMAQGRVMLSDDGVHHGADGFEGMARAVLDALGFADVKVKKTVVPWPYLLNGWERSAPLPCATADPAQVLCWKPYDLQQALTEQPWWDASFAARGAWMPFVHEKPVESVAFGRTSYESPIAMVAEMQVGGSMPLKVWVNGEPVWEMSYPIGHHPNAYRFPISLQQGCNEIIALSNYCAFVGIRMFATS